MSKLSIVTITKNSEGRIGEVVKNALEIGDESIVVDTGSTDRTIEVARQTGAKVVVYPGEFDYSSPRNFGADQASGEWILQLDTDERIDSRFVGRLRKATEDTNFTSYGIIQATVAEEGLVGDSLQPRFYRKGKFGFQGLVHEWLYPMRDRRSLDVVIINQQSILGTILDLFSDSLEGSVVDKRMRLARAETRSLLQAGLPDSIDDLVTVISRCKHLYHIREMGRIQESSLLSLADSAFEKAMSVSPKHQVARAEYGYLLMKTKPSDKDKRVTDLDVRSACLFYLNFMFAFNLVRGGSPEYSLELIDRAISRDPSVYNLLDKADVLKDLGKMKERRDILQEVTARTFGIVQKWSPNYRG